MGNRLYVGNLSYSTTTDQLRDEFGKFGSVTDAKVMEDRDSGRSRGFGFVTFATDAEAQAAIQQMNGAALDGRNLTVNEAREREGGGGGRPPYGGGGGSYGSGGGGKGDKKRRRGGEDRY